MEDRHLLQAARYVELNPVRAKIVATPTQYPWSSARAHIVEKDDGVVRVKPLLDRVEDWKSFLEEGIELAEIRQMEKHARTGRPLGQEGFFKQVLKATGRDLRRQKPGPKRATL